LIEKELESKSNNLSYEKTEEFLVLVFKSFLLDLSVNQIEMLSNNFIKKVLSQRSFVTPIREPETETD
jgi:hypothetical protein